MTTTHDSELPTILTEDVLTLKQAAALLHVNSVSVGRYIREGRPVKGMAVRLEGVWVGGRWKTSREAIARFLESILPNYEPGPVQEIKSPARKNREHERVMARLRAAGFAK